MIYLRATKVYACEMYDEEEEYQTSLEDQEGFRPWRVRFRNLNLREMGGQ